MFKCQKCGKVTEPNEKLNKIVTKTREREYVNTVLNKKTKATFEKITKGTEIVSEIGVCTKCYNFSNKFNTHKKENKINFNRFDKNDGEERKYPNSNYKGKNFDPDYYKKKYSKNDSSRTI